MARMYTTDIPKADAEYVALMVRGSAQAYSRPARIETWGDPDAAVVTLALSETLVEWLRTWATDADGHVDRDGVLWINGSQFPLEVVDNC